MTFIDRLKVQFNRWKEIYPSSEFKSFWPIGLAFGAVGGLIGWLTGSSSTPVVSALLPLVVGLLGAFTYTIFDRHIRSKGLLEQIESAGFDVANVGKIKNVLSSTSSSKPAYWGWAIVFFCLCCVVGVRIGAYNRKPITYAALKVVSEEFHIDDTKLLPDDRAALLNLYWRLQTLGLKQVDIDSVFELVITPSVAARAAVVADNQRKAQVETALAKVTEKLPISYQTPTKPEIVELATAIRELTPLLVQKPDPLRASINTLTAGVPNVDMNRIGSMGSQPFLVRYNYGDVGSIPPP